MMFRIAADTVLLIHLAFILFAAAGALLAIRRPWIAIIQIPAAAWGTFVEISDKVCPLTCLENYFLIKAGRSGYAEDFLGSCLLPLIYPAELTREIQYLLASIVVLINIAAYCFLIYRMSAGKRAS